MSRVFICDHCKNLIDADSLVTIEHKFGYYSKHDGVSVTIDLHENCFAEIFKDQISEDSSVTDWKPSPALQKGIAEGFS